MTVRALRQLTSKERALLGVLLSAPFEGRDDVVRQLQTATVTEIDDSGSLEFHVSSPARANVRHRVPVSAEAPDLDGVPVAALLHVVDGKVKELEIYKADGSPIEQMPEPGDFDVFAPP